MRRKLACALFLVTACGRPAPVHTVAAPAETVSAPAPAPKWTEPVSCLLGLTADERMLFPTDVAGLAVAAIDQTVLFVYHDDQFVLRARTYDLAKHVAGKEIVLDDKGEGIRVAAAGTRFVVSWLGRGNAFAARLVGRDGTPLGDDQVAMPGYEGFSLVPVADGFVIAFQDRGDDNACIAKTLKLDPNLKAIGTPETIAQATQCGFTQTRVIGSEVWVAILATDRAPGHPQIARLDTRAAHLLSPPITIDDVGGAEWVDVIPSPRGALAAYATFTRDASDHVSYHANTRALDATGRYLEATQTPPALVDRQSTFSLLAADRPIITFSDGSLAPLDWEGQTMMPSTRGALYTDQAAWTNVNGAPWLFWNDYRSGDGEAYGAPVGCSGFAPRTKEPAPIVTKKASAPPPKARTCALKLASDALAVPAKPAPARTHRLSAHGTELWIDWWMESADSKEALYLRRFARAGTPLGPAQLLRDNLDAPARLVEGGESFVYPQNGHSHVMKIRADGKSDAASDVDLGVPFDTWTGTALAARDGGDLFWLAGKRGVFETRAFHAKDKPGPILWPQTPDHDVARFRVIERPDGWIAAWRTSDSLVVERSVNGALAWATRVVEPKMSGLAPLALDVVGDQIVVLTSDAETARLMRFRLDGARLDDAALPLPNQALAASVSAHGVAVVDNDACLHLVGFDGKPLAPPSCKKPTNPGARLGFDDIVDPLVWSGDVVAWAYGGMNSDVYLRRWTCE